MMPTSTAPGPRFRRSPAIARSGTDARGTTRFKPGEAPIVVAVDRTRAAARAADAAVRLARDLTAPLVFVYVRRGPSSALGKPYYQRRLNAEMRAGGRALAHALAVAERAGVRATGEQLAGNPARRGRVGAPARRAAGRARLAAPPAWQERLPRSHPKCGPSGPGRHGRRAPRRVNEPEASSHPRPCGGYAGERKRVRVSIVSQATAGDTTRTGRDAHETTDRAWW
jgi:hypothetical protein